MSTSTTMTRCLLMLAFVAASLGTAAAQDYEYDWATALSEEFRFDDMAEKVYTDLSKRSDQAQQMSGKLGLANLKRKQARRTNDLAEQTTLNAAALEMYREVAKNISTSDIKHYEAQVEIADAQVEIANEVIDQITRGVVPADKVEEQRKKADNGLNEAQVIYEKIKAKYGDVDQAKDEKGWLMGRASVLDSARLKLVRGELIATDPTKKGSILWQNEIQGAKDELENFLWDNEGSYIGMVAYLYYGRTLGQLVGMPGSKTDASAVEEAYVNIPRNLIQPRNAEGWTPARDNWLALTQRAYHWMLEFFDGHGLSDKVIEHGEKMRKDWRECGYDTDPSGRMALVYLARAYNATGRSSEALALAADVSARGGYVGREADKLTSVIIKTSVDKSAFDATTLASGANGAFAARTDTKNHECIELYGLVLENLHKIPDEYDRNDLGTLAWYRIGICYDRLGRHLESYAAFETGYKTFNSDKIKEDTKINDTLAKAWRYSARQLKSQFGTSNTYINSLAAAVDDWLIKNPPKGVLITNTDQLLWNKADALYKQKKYAEAKPHFEQLAAKAGDYQERAMVRLGTIELNILKKKKDATPAEWMGAADNFKKYKAFAARKPETDPTRKASRRKALQNADFRLAQCLNYAADAEADMATKKRYYEEIKTAGAGFDSRATDQNLKGFMRGLLIEAYLATDDVDKAGEVFDGLVALDPRHPEVARTALKMANAYRGQYRAMNPKSKEDQAAQEAVMRRAGECYVRWLEKTKTKNYKYWRLIFNIYYDLAESPIAEPEQKIKDYDQAYELIAQAMKNFDGTRRVKAEDIQYMQRKQAKCLLEKARAAYGANDRENTEALFKQAAGIYDELMKEGSKYAKSSTVREEAAMIYGGFLSDRNRRGDYTVFEGNGEFAKAQQLWHRVERLLKTKQAKTAAEAALFKYREQRAYFYKFLMEYQMAKTDNSNAKRMAKLDRNLEALFIKTDKPGGDDWVEPFRWLRRQVR